MKTKDYEAALYKLHVELVKMQLWVRKTGAKIIIVFEGRDAAGKGGLIKRITERVSPRVFRVVALPKPTDRERTQMYVQRYVRHFPAAGEVVIFDRSWYNRAGVERVMGFCTEDQYTRFLDYVPRFEQSIVNSNIILLKYWLDTRIEVQDKRFRDRINDPRKVWKLSPMDVASYQRWYEYSRARDDMLSASDQPHAPWHVVDANDKKSARLNCISHILSQVPYEELTREKVDLGERGNDGEYEDALDPQRVNFIPQKY